MKYQNDHRVPRKQKGSPKQRMNLKNSHLFTEMISKMELPMRIDEDLHFETLSSKNNDEKAKTSLDIEELIQEEIDRWVGNTLPNSEMFSTDYSLSSQNHIAQGGKKQVVSF